MSVQIPSSGDRTIFVEPKGSGLVMVADKLPPGMGKGYGPRRVVTMGSLPDAARLADSDLLQMEGATIRSQDTGVVWEVRAGKWVSRGGIDSSEASSSAAISKAVSRSLATSTHRLRGMTCDQVTTGPSSDLYWDLFARLKPNVARMFLQVQCETLGGVYQPATVWGKGWDEWMQILSASLDKGYSRGIQFVLVMVPSRTNPDKSGAGTLEDRRLPEFWQSTAAIDKYIDRLCDLTAFVLGHPAVLAIDLINEPLPLGLNNQVGADALVAFQNRAIARMRAVDPSRTFIVTCGAEGATAGYQYMKPVEDSNVWYSLHAYQPFSITHSDVAAPLYTGGYPSTVRVAGGLPSLDTTPANINRIRMELQPARAFQIRYNARMFVGEFGCSILNAAGVPANMTEDFITVFEEYGWDYVYHAFGFPSVPFLVIHPPTSVDQVSYSDGTNSGMVAINTVTGATNQSRTPAAPLGQIFEKNTFHANSPQPPLVTFLRADDFEIAGGDWSLAGSANGGGTIDFQSTLYPASGTKHAHCQHNNSSDSVIAHFGLPDWGTILKNKTAYLEFDVRLGVTPASGKNIGFYANDTNGQGSGAYSRIVNIPGTNTWALEVWCGSGNYNNRPFHLIDGLTLPVGAYTKILIELTIDTQYQRFRLWQNGRVLTDINIGANITDSTVDYLWTPKLGLVVSDQRNQMISFDNIKYSLGAKGF